MLSVHVGDRSVQRLRRAPSGENASKQIRPNRQQGNYKNVTVPSIVQRTKRLKAAEIRGKSYCHMISMIFEATMFFPIAVSALRAISRKSRKNHPRESATAENHRSSQRDSRLREAL